MLQLFTPTGAAFNPGRIINFLTGITGVAAGGVGTVQVPVNRRIHKIWLNFVAVNYTGGTGLATTNISSSGTGLTITPTIVNGVITAVAIVAAGSGYAANDTVTLVDPTGTGAIIKIATVSGGAAATLTIVNSGTASAVNPATVLTALVLKVNGVSMCDILPSFLTMISQANGVNTALGELAIDFTEEWRNWLRSNVATSWDLFGQNTFEIDMTFASTVSQIGVTGQIEFDFTRNLLPDGKTPFLEPIARHQYTLTCSGASNAPAMNPFTWLPHAYPIARIWLLGSSPGNITQLEVLQDGQKVLEALVPTLKNRYQENGFKFGQADYMNQNQTSAKTLGLNPIAYFDAACLFDNDQRFGKALRCKNTFELRIWSSASQNVTAIMESMPGAYQS